MTAYPAGYQPHAVKKLGAPCRYALEIDTPYPNERLTLFVLMMNPSVADETQSDPTVNLLLNNLGSHYHEVTIVNTTPIIETDSKNLKNRVPEINKYMLANSKTVARMIKKAGHFHILIATGEIIRGVNDKAYISLMDQIRATTIGDAFYTVQLTKAGYGGHPLYKSKDKIQHLTHIVPVDAQWHWAVG